MPPLERRSRPWTGAPVLLSGLVGALGCVGPWLVGDYTSYSFRGVDGPLGKFALVWTVVLIGCGACIVFGFGWLWTSIVATVGGVWLALVTIFAAANRDLIVDGGFGDPTGFSVGWGAYTALAVSPIALAGSIVALCRRGAPPVR